MNGFLRLDGYGNLVTTFTSSKWPSLPNFSALGCCCQLPNANLRGSLSHSIGSSDGRCVQRCSPLHSSSGLQDHTSQAPGITELHLENRFHGGTDYILSPFASTSLLAKSPLPFSLWTAFHARICKFRTWLRITHCDHLCRFYHTRGSLPLGGHHRVRFRLDLPVGKALGLPRNLTVSPSVPLKTCAFLSEAHLAPCTIQRAGT